MSIIKKIIPVKYHKKCQALRKDIHNIYQNIKNNLQGDKILYKNKSNNHYNYCLVGAHGTGMTSFIYYLYKLGVPCTPFYSQRKFLQKINLKYSITGICIDRYLQSNKRENVLLGHSVPVVWLVRDPISLLVSNINQMISDSLLDFFENQRATFPVYETYVQKLKFIIDDPLGTHYPYYKQLCRIENIEKLFVVDTSDILPENCPNTMKEVCSFLGAVYDEKVEDIFRIKFNNFENSVWWRRDMEPIVEQCENIDFFIHSMPTIFYDFYKFFDFHNKDFYASTCHEEYTLYSTTKIRRKDFISIVDKNINKIEKLISIKKEIISYINCVYSKEKVSKEQVVADMKKDKSILRSFLEAQRETILFLKKNNPSVIEKWKDFNGLL